MFIYFRPGPVKLIFQYQRRFADPVGIAKHHRGALTILAHFHYCCNRGTQPFTKALDLSGLLEFAEDAELNVKQVRFVRDTAIWVKARGRKFVLQSSFISSFLYSYRATC